MKLRSIHFSIFIIIILIGGIGIANITGLYITTRSRIPKRLNELHYDVSDIRGSYTLKEIEKYFNIPTSVIIKAFKLPENIDPEKFKLKDLKQYYEEKFNDPNVETDQIRIFVSIYNNIPYTPEKIPPYLPSFVIKYLKDNNKLNNDEEKFLKGEIKEVLYSTKEKTTNLLTSSSDDFVITGSTTFQELIDIGISNEIFKKITGFNMPSNKKISLRDYFKSINKPFGEYKSKIQEYIDKKINKK